MLKNDQKDSRSQRESQTCRQTREPSRDNDLSPPRQITVKPPRGDVVVVDDAKEARPNGDAVSVRSASSRKILRNVDELLSSEIPRGSVICQSKSTDKTVLVPETRRQRPNVPVAHRMFSVQQTQSTPALSARRNRASKTSADANDAGRSSCGSDSCISSRPGTASSIASFYLSQPAQPLKELLEKIPMTQEEDFEKIMTYFGISKDNMKENSEEPEGEDDVDRTRRQIYVRREIIENGTTWSERSIGLAFLVNAIDTFSSLPVTPGFHLKCRVTRRRKGLERSYSPCFYLHLERKNDKKTFLLAAQRKRSFGGLHYVISTDPSDFSEDSSSCIAQVVSNFKGTEFTLYDAGIPYHKVPKGDKVKKVYQGIIREEIGSVIYDSNVLGISGPRKMKIALPKLITPSQRHEIRPRDEKETIMNRWKKYSFDEMEEIVVVKNKEPEWNESSSSHTLDFKGRANYPSVKNFQIIHPDIENYIMMQFGRFSADVFSLDFSFPLSPVQAFGIALTSFDSKLTRE